MLTAARLREYTGPARLLDLLRDLGYPVAPVEIDPAEWQRGGVIVPNGASRVKLAVRDRHFDLFVCTEDGVMGHTHFTDPDETHSDHQLSSSLTTTNAAWSE